MLPRSQPMSSLLCSEFWFRNKIGLQYPHDINCRRTVSLLHFVSHREDCFWPFYVGQLSVCCCLRNVAVTQVGMTLVLRRNWVRLKEIKQKTSRSKSKSTLLADEYLFLVDGYIYDFQVKIQLGILRDGLWHINF